MSKPSSNVDPDERSQSFVLVINAGSSSLKFAVFRGDLEPDRLLSGVFDRIGAAGSTFTLKLMGNPELDHETVSAQNHASCLDDPRAADAIALFCYQAKKWIGSFAAVLNGIDTIVFSGGIGENCASIRTRICTDLGFLGVELNESNNSQQAMRISADGTKVAVYVIKTDEELVIARSAIELLNTFKPSA